MVHTFVETPFNDEQIRERAFYKEISLTFDRDEDQPFSVLLDDLEKVCEKHRQGPAQF